MHWACVKIAQNAAALVAAGRQHAPRPAGGGHWAASQPTPLCHVPCRFAHTAAVVTMQREFVVEIAGLQHAPRGTQMSLLHTVPLPRYVPFAAAQSAAVMIVHPIVPAAVARQQAPRGVGWGQVVLVHTELSPL